MAPKRKSLAHWKHTVQSIHSHLIVHELKYKEDGANVYVECKLCGKKEWRRVYDITRTDRNPIGCNKCGGESHVAYIENFYTDSDKYQTRKFIAELEGRVKKLYSGRIRIKPGQTINSRGQYVQFECLTEGCEHSWSTKISSVVDIIRMDGKNAQQKNLYGCSKCASRAKSDSAGKNRKPRATNAEKHQAREMRAAGKTYIEIGKLLGRCHTTIRFWCDEDARLRSVESHKKWKERNPESDRINNQRYYNFEHGKAAHYQKNAHRRALENNSIDDIYLGPNLDELNPPLVEPQNIDHKWFETVNMFEYVKGDAEGSGIFVDRDASRKYVELQKVCKYYEELTGEAWEVDHLWALSKGGPHTVENFACKTKEVNNSKLAKYDEQSIKEYCCRLFSIK